MLDRARYRLSSVLTSLINHDRRLTQRLVELARDPLNYFGNLVSTVKETDTSSVCNVILPSADILEYIFAFR